MITTYPAVPATSGIESALPVVPQATMPHRDSTEQPGPIAITMGDPAGIGPEIILKALLAQPEHVPDAQGKRSDFVVYGDPALLAARASRLGLNAEPLRVVSCGQVPPDLTPGRLDPRAGEAAYQAVQHATLDALAG